MLPMLVIVPSETPPGPRARTRQRSPSDAYTKVMRASRHLSRADPVRIRAAVSPSRP